METVQYLVLSVKINIVYRREGDQLEIPKPNTVVQKSRDTTRLHAILIIFGNLAVILPEINRVRPSTSGWYWVLAWSEQIPYRDYFFPFPPGAILTEGILPRVVPFADPWLSQDVLHAAMWVTGQLALYGITRRATTNGTAFIGVLVTGVIYLTRPGNIVAGYYETMLALLAVHILLVLRGIESRSRLGQYVSGFAAGLSLSLACSVKQTVGLYAVIALMFSIRILAGSGKKDARGGVRKAFRYSLEGNLTVRGFVFGVGVSLTVLSAYLIYYSTTPMFFEQVFSGGGKGTGSLSFIQIVGAYPFQFGPLVLLVIAGGIALLTRMEQYMQSGMGNHLDGETIGLPKDIKSLQMSRKCGNLYDALFLLGCAIALGLPIYSLGPARSGIGILVLFIAAGSVVIAVGPHRLRQMLSWSTRRFGALGITLYTVAVVIFTYSREPERASGILEFNFERLLGEIDVQLTPLFYFFGFIGIAVAVTKWSDLQRMDDGTAIRSENPGGELTSSPLRNVNNDLTMRMAWVLLAITTVSIQLMNSFAGGPTLETFLLVSPLGIALFVALHPRRANYFGLLRPAAALLLVGSVLLVGINAQRQSPYSWLGVQAAPRDTTELDLFELFFPSVDPHHELRATLLDRSLSEYPLENVWVGPRNPGLMSVQPSRISNEFCVVLWFDICSEQHAELEERRIKDSDEKLILWTFETENELLNNELAWRAGEESAVRRIQSFLKLESVGGRAKILWALHEEPNGTGPLTVMYYLEPV